MSATFFRRLARLIPLSLCICLIAYSGAAAQCNIVFSEDFESGSLDGNWVPFHEFGNWTTSGFETRPEFVHSGKKSFRLRMPREVHDRSAPGRTQ